MRWQPTQSLISPIFNRCLSWLSPHLRVDFNLRAVANQAPDLFDFCVSDCDATLRPIGQPMRLANVPLTIRETVDHDIAARSNAQPSRLGAIGRVRVRHS